MIFKLNFQKKIFINFSIIILVVIIVFSFAFYKYSSKILLNNYFDNSKQLSEKISNQIDMRLKQLDVAAMGITYNNDVQSVMSSLNNNKITNDIDMLTYNSIVNKSLKTLFYCIPDATRTIIFNSNKDFYFYYGMSQEEPDVFNQKLKDTIWYNNLMEPGKLSSIIPPHYDDWSTNPKLVVSLLRKFNSPYSNELGIIEVQIPYSALESSCKVSSMSSDYSVIIMDNQGRKIFPFNPVPEYDGLFQKYLNNETLTDRFKGSGELKLSNKDKLLYGFYKSDYSSWTVFLTSKQTQLLKQLQFYRNITAITGVIILALIMTAFFLLSKTLTKPLKQLTSTVERVSLDNMNLEVPHDGNDEFKILNESFTNMFSKLKDSINKVYESKIRESNAHLLALQAQMNPHFLYNSLYAIIAAGEEFGVNASITMCRHLANMMRYITSPVNCNITIGDELSHTMHYLDLQKVPYEDSLKFEVSIQDSLLSAGIPKLTIQPLIENCIKHGFKNIRPPWEIKIVGRYETENSWIIIIEDNGSGFNDGVLTKLNKQMEEFRLNLIEGNFKENLEIGGMGIINIYSRLAINFKENLIFKITNKNTQGSIVSIGVTHIDKGGADDD